MSKILGVDLGTMFFQTAEESSGGNVSIKTMRNAFVEIAATDDIEDILKQNSWQYVKDGKHYYILGEDSLRVANMFPGKVELRRPLQDGVLNKGEEKKMLVLSEMIKNAIGKAPDKTSVVCTCVSSPSVDDSPDSAFHKARISGMLQQLGYNVKVIEEGHAVVLGERPSITEIVDGKEVERPYSGIGISFGSGRVNCVLAYKGLQVLGMSAARCLSKDFLVLTKCGYRSISDVVAGDLVLDAHGEFVEVLNVINNGHRESLVGIEVDNLPFIHHKMTGDHRVFVKRHGKWDWTTASDVSEGDIIGEPVVRHTSLKRSYYYGFDKVSKKGLKGNRSRNLGRIFGLFLGDGSTNLYKNGQGYDSGYTQWVFNSNDDDMINEYNEIISSYFDRDVCLTNDGNMVRIKLHMNSVAKHFKEKFYNEKGVKVCPLSLCEIPNQMAIGIIQGLIDSDGNSNSRNGFDFNNTSLDVAILFHQILNRFGISHSFMKREPRLGGINSEGVQIVGKKVCYAIRISGFSSDMLRLLFDFKTGEPPIQTHDITEYRVKNTSEVEYNDDVYDLSINSSHHSFSSVGCIVHNCGDWIDQKVSEATGAPISQVTKKKEVELDFVNLKDDDDIIFALNAYYTSMIEFVFSKFSSHFQKVKSQFEAPLEVVVAGGTSMPKGFCDKVSEVISSLELPFVIKSVRHAKDPRNAVVKGCLTYAASAYRKMQQSKDDTVAKSME